MTQYAAERARLMFGCYRRGDANDPDTYVAAITAMLSSYPEDVIKDVTHPVSGLPGRITYLPSVAEVRQECEAKVAYRRTRAAMEARFAKQIAEREQIDAAPKDEMQRVGKGLKELAEQIAAGGNPSTAK